MKGVKPRAVPTWKNVTTVKFSRDGKNGPIELTLNAHRDIETGETRVQVTIPYAEQLVFPDDLGVLLQCFGWGMASMGCRLMPVRSMDAWCDCCWVVTKVEHCLRLD
jgi:hypothetical protein